MTTLIGCAAWLAGWVLLLTVLAVFVMVIRLAVGMVDRATDAGRRHAHRHDDPECGACPSGTAGRR